MLDIGLIFSAAGLAKSVAQMMGIMESLDTKVDRLVKSELNAGFRNLDQAALSQTEQAHLLREARSCFNRAASLETGYRRSLALLGCALCHHHLGDDQNCRKSLEELVEMLPPIGTLTITAASAADTFKGFRRGGIITFFRSYWGLIYQAVQLTFSSKARVAYQKRMVIEAINLSPEARSFMQLQQGASQYVGRPIKWLVDLDRGQSPFLREPFPHASASETVRA
jgi:hypothetical protein